MELRGVDRAGALERAVAAGFGDFELPRRPRSCGGEMPQAMPQAAVGHTFQQPICGHLPVLHECNNLFYQRRKHIGGQVLRVPHGSVPRPFAPQGDFPPRRHGAGRRAVTDAQSQVPRHGKKEAVVGQQAEDVPAPDDPQQALREDLLHRRERQEAPQERHHEDLKPHRRHLEKMALALGKYP